MFYIYVLESLKDEKLYIGCIKLRRGFLKFYSFYSFDLGFENSKKRGEKKLALAQAAANCIAINTAKSLFDKILNKALFDNNKNT